MAGALSFDLRWTVRQKEEVSLNCTQFTLYQYAVYVYQYAVYMYQYMVYVYQYVYQCAL